MRQPGPWRRGERGWYIKIDGVQIKLKVANDATEKQARQAWRELQDERRHGVVRPERPTLFELLALFTAQLDEGTKKYRDYAAIVGSFIAYVGEDREAESLSEFDMKNWLDSKVTWSDTSKAKAVVHVNGVLNWAAGKTRRSKTPKPAVPYIDRNPLRDYVGPRRAVRLFDLTPDIAERFFAAALPKFALFCRVLYATGMRPSELAAANREDAGEDGRTIVVDKGKVDAANRIVHVPAEAVEIVKAARAEATAKGPLFTNDRGIREGSSVDRWNECSWGQAGRRTRQKARIAAGATVYSIRHAAITRMLEAGMTPLAVATQTATSLRMLDEVYAKRRGSQVRQQIGKLYHPAEAAGARPKVARKAKDQDVTA